MKTAITENVIDCEYRAKNGEKVEPVSVVSKDLASGETVRVKIINGGGQNCPLSLSESDVYVTFSAGAEASFFDSMKWPNPKNVIDLFVETKMFDNRSSKEKYLGGSLLAALSRRGLSAIDAAEKAEMRDLILSKPIYTDSEWVKILDYNEQDVIATERLYSDMILMGDVELPFAEIRGLFAWYTGVIEQNGIPIDTHLFDRIKNVWEKIELLLIQKVDKNFGVYDGRTFKVDRFLRYLQENDLPWIYSDEGKPLLDSTTFRDMAQRDARFSSLYELRRTLGQLRLKDFPVGTDGRNRTNLRPFSSITGRCQPSNAKFLFGAAKWFRSFAKPAPGMALGYVDQSQQEFGIAAALSGDHKMKDAYLSGDPYLAFAKQAGALPSDATKKSHPKERELYKSCTLAVQYGMGSSSLALRIGKPQIYAHNLLNQHKDTYKIFWEWSSRVLEFARTKGFLETAFGWRLLVDPNFNERSIANFPMQANGAEILRLATIEAFHNNIKVIGLIHDAILIEAPEDLIDVHTKKMQDIFTHASEVVLNGFKLNSDSEIVKYPNRYVDEKGADMWRLIMETLNEVELGQF